MRHARLVCGSFFVLASAALAEGCSTDAGTSSDRPPTPDDGASGGGSQTTPPSKTTPTGTDPNPNPGPDPDPSDAGPDGAKPGGGGPAPDCAGLAYCDDFETYPVGALANAAALGPWKASLTANATLAIDGTKGFNGTKALHVTATKTSASGTHGLITQANAAGLVPGDDLFGRAMVFYSKTNAGTGLPLGVHSWVFRGWGNTDETNVASNINIGGGAGSAAVQANYHFAEPPTAVQKEANKTGGTMTAGAWHCLQWQYDGSGTPAADHTKVWLDGAVAVDVPKTVGWTLPTWKSMDFGFVHYQATMANAVDVYLDDFAVDKAMIACPVAAAQ